MTLGPNRNQLAGFWDYVYDVYCILMAGLLGRPRYANGVPQSTREKLFIIARFFGSSFDRQPPISQFPTGGPGWKVPGTTDHKEPLHKLLGEKSVKQKLPTL